MSRQLLSTLIMLALLVAACAPAATATPTRSLAAATATATPLRPGVTPPPATPSPTPRPTPTLPPVAVKSGGLLTMVNDPRDPRGWDGWADKAGSRDIRIRHNLVFSTLFANPATPETDCKLVFTPELAESWKWLTDSLLEVKIRQGVKFHNKPPVNGRELAAQDVAWSATQFIKENTIRGMAPIAPGVSKIEATDRYTVHFHTVGPLPVLLSEGLANAFGAIILPREVVAPDGTWSNPYKSYIGSGPFMFQEHVPGVSTNFAKHPGYFKKGLPYLDAVKYVVMPDISTQVAALRGGRVDMVFGPVPAPMATALQKAPGIKVSSCLAVTSIPGRFYFRVDHPPFNDVRVRRAIQMAYDRDAMLAAVLQGQGVTAPHSPAQIAEGWVGWEELPPDVAQWVKYNPRRARELLAEAGYPKGFEATMVMVTYRTPFPETVEALAGFLKEIGIVAKLRFMPVVEWVGVVQSDEFKPGMMAFGLVSPGDRMDSSSAWYGKSTVTSNRSRIRDPEVDRLTELWLKELDAAKSTQWFKQLVLRVLDQAWEPTAGIFPLEFSAVRDYVKDFRGGHQYYASTYLERIWLDK